MNKNFNFTADRVSIDLDKFYAMLKKKKINKRDLCIKAGVNVTYLNDVQRRPDYGCDAEVFRTMCKILNIRPSYYIVDSRARKKPEIKTSKNTAKPVNKPKATIKKPVKINTNWEKEEDKELEKKTEDKQEIVKSVGIKKSSGRYPWGKSTVDSTGLQVILERKEPDKIEKMFAELKEYEQADIKVHEEIRDALRDLCNLLK